MTWPLRKEDERPRMPAHSETRRLPYTAAQMYDLVANVADYPAVHPVDRGLARALRDAEGDSDVMLADLVVGFKMFRERFLSRVTMWEGTRRIDTEYIEGRSAHELHLGRSATSTRAAARWPSTSISSSRTSFAGRGGAVLPRGDAADRARLRGAGRRFTAPAPRPPERRRSVKRVEQQVERVGHARPAHRVAAARAEIHRFGIDQVIRRHPETDAALGLELRPAGAGDAGDGNRDLRRREPQRPFAISAATCSDTAPWSLSVASATPSISILAALE
jgi:hypothetical protein